MSGLMRMTVAAIALLGLSGGLAAQVDEDQLGAWYMYMWNHDREDSRFGFQGDVQYRNWDLMGDLEQLLIRGGITWRPEEQGSIKLTLGIAHVTTGEFGNRNSGTTEEFRFYQEALIPHRIGRRAYLTHRFRLEQRDVQGQDIRNRLRYFLALNYPLNQDTLGKGAFYLSFYNEIFVNLERNIGNGRRVDSFDRNRAYGALGYAMSDTLRLQFGYMYQNTKPWDKGQLQFNVVHNF